MLPLRISASGPRQIFFILGFVEDKMADAVAPDLSLWSSGIVPRNNSHPPTPVVTRDDL